ncbi:hypothetical protein J5X84_31295 [Streptosporangiaceae bacterium NEAU-GS5]|nr:hypothetical protein [Streptosporangiaceae bacterium NEAU-GS5]
MKIANMAGRALRTLALAGLTVAALSVPAHSAQATTQAGGRCVLTLAKGYLEGDWRVENNCTPANRSDRLMVTKYFGADWPDNDDHLFDRKYPTMDDVFTAYWPYLNEDRATSDELYTINWFIRVDGSLYDVESNEVHQEVLP